jgi:CspA family cold shock protein
MPSGCCGKPSSSLTQAIFSETPMLRNSTISPTSHPNLPYHAGSRVIEEITMLTVRVKWFDAAKGYGFIIPDDGGRDLFVHITAVQKAGYTNLVQGTRVNCEVRPDREGNPTAESLKIGYRPD